MQNIFSQSMHMFSSMVNQKTCIVRNKHIE